MPIDPTKPAEGEATTQSVRDNFTACADKDAENTFTGAGLRYQDFVSVDSAVGLRLKPGTGPADGNRFSWVAGGGNIDLQALDDADGFVGVPLRSFHTGQGVIVRCQLGKGPLF